MTAAATIGTLADELAGVLLRGDPFGGAVMAISGYDDAVPDLTPEYQQGWRGRLVDIIARCAGTEADPGDAGGRVLLETARDTAARELAAADSRVFDFSITTFPLGGLSLVLLIASRTSVTDAESATAYLARCRRIPVYLDQHAAGLPAAGRAGLLPVAPLVSDAIRQLRDHLSHPERDPMLSHRPPDGWARAAAWRDEVERVIRDEVRPAVGRYADLLAELLPRSRPPEQAGLLYVPGGIAAYASCIRNGTTLPFDPDELHPWAWRPWRKSRSRSASSAARRWAPRTSTRSWSGSARTPSWPLRMARPRWRVRPPRSRAPRNVCRTCSARRCRRRAPSSPCHPTWPSSARHRTTRRRPGTARAPERTCSTTSAPDRPEAGPWRPRPFTKGCRDTMRSSPGCSSCRSCRCCFRGSTSCRTARAGACMPNGWPTSSACTPTTSSGWACSAAPPSGPSGSSSTPGCTPEAGAGRGPGSSRWRTRPCPRTSSTPRSTGTSRCPARRWAT